MRPHRFDLLAVRRVGLAADAQHAGHARTVDIGVHQADPPSLRLECEREVDSRGRFADTAFTGRDRNQRANTGELWFSRLLGLRTCGPWACRLRGTGGWCASRRRRRMCGEHCRHRQHARQGVNRLLTGFA